MIWKQVEEEGRKGRWKGYGSRLRKKKERGDGKGYGGRLRKKSEME